MAQSVERAQDGGSALEWLCNLCERFRPRYIAWLREMIADEHPVATYRTNVCRACQGLLLDHDSSTTSKFHRLLSVERCSELFWAFWPSRVWACHTRLLRG